MTQFYRDAVIDSLIWIGAFSDRDQYRKVSKLILEHLRKGIIKKVYVTDYVLIETVNFLLRKEGAYKLVENPTDTFYYDKENFMVPLKFGNRKYIGRSKPKRARMTNDTIELQKALGRMAVREGDLPECQYMEFVQDVYRLAELYDQNPTLTLESITDVNGLNAALGPFANERALKEIGRVYYGKNELEFPDKKYLNLTPKLKPLESPTSKKELPLKR